VDRPAGSPARPVRLLAAGGTIAMQGERAVPALDADDLIAAVPQLAAYGPLVAETVLTLPGPQIGLPDALELARRACAAGEAGDGVVITTGTDTLEELAPFSGKRRTTGMREGNERVLRRRSSESRRPRVMRWRPVRAQRSVDRGACRLAIEPRNWACSGCRRARKQRKATPRAAFSRAASGPRGVEEPEHACDLSMLRTGRAHGHPLVVMVGRVVRGRPMAVIP